MVPPLWTARHSLVAAAGGVCAALRIGLPTDVVPNPLFGRAMAVTWWSYPTLAVVAVLSGLLLATYVRTDDTAALPEDDPARRGLASGALSLFAVGCPVCNKLVLLALGYSGAMTWFAPGPAAAGGAVGRRPGGRAARAVLRPEPRARCRDDGVCPVRSRPKRRRDPSGHDRRSGPHGRRGLCLGGSGRSRSGRRARRSVWPRARLDHAGRRRAASACGSCGAPACAPIASTIALPTS